MKRLNSSNCANTPPVGLRRTSLLLALLLSITFGVGQMWGAVDYIIPKLYLASRNTPSGNTGWTFTNDITINNANTDYWKMIKSSSVATSPSFDISNYSSVTVSVKWQNYGTFNSSKCNATVQISTGSNTWYTLGTTELTAAGTTTKTFENVETHSSYSSAQIQISTPNADNSVGGRLFIVEIKGEVATTCSTPPTVGTNLTSVSATANSITATVPISSIGGCNITENGLVYSASVQTPTVGATGCTKVTTTACGATAANKEVTIENLDCGTTYYVRGYAINAAGTQYTTNTTTQATSDCPVDHFIDEVQSTTGYTGEGMAKVGSYGTTPSLTDKATATSGTCQEQHYHFVGWITAAKYEAGTAIADGDLQTPISATGATYYAVWAKGTSGGEVFDHYEKVTTAPTDWTAYKYVYATADDGYVLTGKGEGNYGAYTTMSTTTEMASYEITVENGSTDNYKLKQGGKYISCSSFGNLYWNDSYTAKTSSVNNGDWMFYKPSGTAFRIESPVKNSNNKWIYIDFNTSANPKRFNSYVSGNQTAVYLYKRVTTTGYTYFDYIAKCCNELGQINGSFFWTTHFCPVLPAKHRS